METTDHETSETPEVVQRLNRDLVKAASTLSVDEARYLVDAYYAIQEQPEGGGQSGARARGVGGTART